MAQEIERKFLVLDQSWRDMVEGVEILQGYLAKEGGITARVRTKGEKGFLTIKGPTNGLSRAEFEYEIPVTDAKEMLELSNSPIIHKHRYHVPYGKHLWEVDVFHGDNAGLIVAEIELEEEEEAFESPPWLGEEVSGEARYYNSRLAEFPFCSW